MSSELARPPPVLLILCPRPSVLWLLPCQPATSCWLAWLSMLSGLTEQSGLGNQLQSQKGHSFLLPALCSLRGISWHSYLSPEVLQSLVSSFGFYSVLISQSTHLPSQSSWAEMDLGDNNYPVIGNSTCPSFSALLAKSDSLCLTCSLVD